MWTPFQTRQRKFSLRPASRRTMVPRLEPLEQRLALSTFLVSSTADSGLGTLRQAILDANAAANNSSGPDVIEFNLGPGVQTINVAGGLPQITDAVIINGTTGPGGVPLIELSGANAGAWDVLFISANNCSVSGLVVNGFSNFGITITGNGNLVQGNYIGTNAAGTAAVGHGNSGVVIADASNNRVEGNVVSGTGTPGSVQGTAGAAVVVIQNTGTAQANIVTGNKIGTSADGMALIPNVNGVFIGGGARGNVVEANLISGNTWFGVTIAGDVGIPQVFVTSGNVVRGNTITGNYNGVEVGAGPGFVFEASGFTVPTLGTKNNTVQDNIISGNRNYGVVVDGIRADSNVVYHNTIQANSSYGVAITGGAQFNAIGDVGLPNTISGNGGGGILIRNLGTDFFPGYDFFIANSPTSPTADNIVPAIANKLRANSIFDNGGLGIDLGGDGVTANDPLDADLGPNNLQNFPLITAAHSGPNTHVSGSLQSLPGISVELDFYASSATGQRWLGHLSLPTDGSGNATFDDLLANHATVAGEMITATATSSGNTSEFSVPAPVTDLIVTGTAGDDTYVFQVKSKLAAEVFLNGVSQGFSSHVFVNDTGGSDNYTANFAGMKGNVTVTLNDTGKDDADTLTVNGTAGDDAILKQADEVRLEFLDLFHFDARVDFAGIESVTVDGGAGNDTIIDPGTDTTILGGEGDDMIIINATFGNGVVVDGGEGSDTYVVLFGNLAGPVTVADSGVTGVDSLTVNGTPGDDAITLAGNEVQRGAERVIIAAPIESLVVNAGDGSDTMSVVDFTAPISSLGLNGGAGTNQVSVEGSLPPGVELEIVGATQTVQIDVLRNCVNLASNGVIAVAVFTTANFDAASIDVGTVLFAGAHAVHSALEDADGDGDLDMVLQFRTQDTNLRALYEQLLADDINGDGVLDANHQQLAVSLTGQTVDDVFFEGFDALDLFLSGKKLRELLVDLAAAGRI